MERLRSSRAKLLDRYRQAGERVCGPATGALLVQEVMEQEWQTLQAVQESLPALRGTEALAQVSTNSWADAVSSFLASTRYLSTAGVSDTALCSCNVGLSQVGVGKTQGVWVSCFRN